MHNNKTVVRTLWSLGPTTLAFVCLVGLSGCIGHKSKPQNPPTAVVVAGTAQAGFERFDVPTSLMPIAVWKKGRHGPNGMHVYIEGDGYAWRSSTQPSNDPTPRNPVALRLALKDPAASVLYISRPCQYVMAPQRKACDKKYWTNHRFSPEVVSAIDEVINHFVGNSETKTVGLVGFSGGGAIAALLAARRADVRWLITVAGNLDTDAWTSHHRVTPLNGSTNPRLIANRISDLPQLHLFGGRDEIMPAAISKRYRAQINGFALRAQTIDSFDHSCCWAERWVDFVKPNQWPLRQ